LGNINCSTHTVFQLLEEVELLLNNKKLKPRTILCVNAHIYNIAYKDAQLRQILNTARVVTADGISIVWASRFFGIRKLKRCNMTEAFRAFLNSDNIPQNTGILIGLTDKDLLKAKKKIENSSKHCHIIKFISGYLTEDRYKQILASFRDVGFVFLGMSSPRTEKVSKIVETICPDAIVWHIGAGTIKIFAGEMKEAPIFLRRLGLQWLHRFFCNPSNLWRRYLIGNPKFVLRMAKIWVKSWI